MDAIEQLKQFLNDKLNTLQKKALSSKPNLYNQDQYDTVIQQLQINNLVDYIKKILAQLTLLKDMMRLANISKEQQLFHDFAPLYTYLDTNGFSMSNIIAIIFHLIEHNLKVMKEVEDITTIKPFEFRIATMDEFVKFLQLSNDEVSQLLKSGISLEVFGIELKPNAKFIPTYLIEQTHQKIQKHYLNQLDTYTALDIQKVIDALYELKMPGSFCGAFENKLKKELQKRTNNQMNVEKKEHPKSISSTLLSSKEYKEMIKVIKNAYNEYTGEFLVEMNEDEIDHLASLMIQLNYDRKRINQFYMDFKRSKMRSAKNRQAKNSIEEFAELAFDIEFYSKNIPRLKELEKDAIDYLYESFRWGEPDCRSWYQEFQNIVFKLKMSIPADYDSKYARAMRLATEEEQKRKYKK